MEDVKLTEIAYLEDFDIDKDGELINKMIKNKTIPILIMIQTSWCHFCRKAKPAFQEYSDKTSRKEVFCATIQCDGERKSEQILGKRVSKIIPEANGFPHYCVYLKGKLLNKNIKGFADIKQLEELTGVRIKEA
jgi:thiol-disulfide isomerase/thioredoxin